MKKEVKSFVVQLINDTEEANCYISARCLAIACVKKANNPCDIARFWLEDEREPQNISERALMFGLFIDISRRYGNAN